MTVFSRLPLMNGTADVVLLLLVAWSLQDNVADAVIWGFIGGVLVSYVSALPLYVPLIAYMTAVIFTRIIKRQIWQTRILTFLAAVLFATIFYQLLSIGALIFTGTPLPIGEAINRIVIPSTFLNLLVGIPIYVIVSDFARWVLPVKEEYG
jgi:rod shape-determining protein MreD